MPIKSWKLLVVMFAVLLASGCSPSVSQKANVNGRNISIEFNETLEPVLNDGEFANVRFLDGSDGVRYIKYTASILTGQKLIADDKAYLLPLGVENMFYMAFAPTDNDFTLCTQEARTMYMWSEQTRHGYHFEMESNCLYGNKLPHLIAHFDKDAA